MSQEAADRGSRRVLIADESTTYRAVASRVLADAGYLVRGVGDGALALEELTGASPRYDLLILELGLPKVRGLDIIRRVREDRDLGATRLLVVTESMTKHLRRVLADLRLDASLTKNHALRELLYQVDAVLFPHNAEQRRSPRRLSNLPVNFWVGTELFLQSCFDVCDDGMFVTVADADPPPIGSVLSLRFWLPTSDRLIVCDAEVVWLNTAAGDLRMTHPPGMGLRFSRIADADLALVREFVATAA